MFIEMMDVLRKFIHAERTGNWLLNSSKLKEMLPFHDVFSSDGIVERHKSKCA